MQKVLPENELYERLLSEDWSILIEFLYYNRKDIAKDDRLSYIASLVETEFFRKLKDYGQDRDDIFIAAESFYQLHCGKFYKLKNENFEAVKLELLARNPTQYSHFAKRDFEQTVELLEEEAPLKNFEENVLPANWINIYNRLFEIMDVREDAETYFSGPRFINLVRKYDRYYPDYYQYIRQREQQNVSTTRKVFFEDILAGLSSLNRKKVIDNILGIIRPYDGQRVNQIEILLYGKKISVEESKGQKNKVVVFISYSWDSEEHKGWVLTLANKLSGDGFEVKIDRYSMRLGTSAPYTMEQGIEHADKVLVIFTPGYKERADDRKGGVGYEYSIMNAKLYDNQTVNSRIIPVLRSGSKQESIPTFMQQFIHVDMRDDAKFESNYNDLKHDLMTL